MFFFQVVKAQEAGAVAVIITDADEENDDLFIIMQDDTTEREVTIPAGFLLGMNGYESISYYGRNMIIWIVPPQY